MGRRIYNNICYAETSDARNARTHLNKGHISNGKSLLDIAVVEGFWFSPVSEAVLFRSGGATARGGAAQGVTVAPRGRSL